MVLVECSNTGIPAHDGIASHMEIHTAFCVCSVNPCKTTQIRKSDALSPKLRPNLTGRARVWAKLSHQQGTKSRQETTKGLSPTHTKGSPADLSSLFIRNHTIFDFGLFDMKEMHPTVPNDVSV